MRLIRSAKHNFTNPANEIAVVDFDKGRDLVMLATRDGMFYVVEVNTDPDAWDDNVLDFDTIDEAYAEFQKFAEAPIEPNWEAQARYDEIHGTENGYDPKILAWEREFANEH